MNFYRTLIDEGRRKKYAYGILLGEYIGNQIICKYCGRDWREELLLKEDTQLNIALSNEYYPDFLYVIHNNLVSERVKEIFEIENITGCYFQDINVVSRENLSKLDRQELRDSGIKINKIPNSPLKYYRLIVKRSAELHSESNVLLQEECKHCGYEYYDKIDDFDSPDYIKEKLWNGDDLFMVKEYGSMVYCSERFVEVYKKYKLTGLEFDIIKGL